MKSIVAALLSAMFGLPASAGEQAVSLSVPGMYCASCPYVVQAAIGRVEGVKAIRTDVNLKTANVIFDDVVATIDAILSATSDAGYPASVISAGP